MMDPSNRRSILKAAVGTTLTLSGIGYHCQSRAEDTSSPNEKLNLGAIGVWTRGNDNIIAIATENIAAICDVDTSHLNQAHARHTRAKKYVDFREMLTQKDLDAVIVSTPDHTHYHATMMAIERGLHVYCEKPLAHSVTEVNALVTAAKQSGVTTQHGNQHHASRGYHSAVATIQSNAIGQVQEVHSWTTKPHWPQGVDRPTPTKKPAHLDWDSWLGPAPARPYADVYHPVHWRGFWDFGTGALGDMGPHLLDPVFTALELTTPTRIRPTSSNVNGETAPSWSVVEFEFSTVKHARTPLTVTWYDGNKQPPAKTTGISRLPPNGTMFIGERGRLFVPQLGRDPILLMNDGQEEPPKVDVAKTLNQHQEWLAACKTNSQPDCAFAAVQPLVNTCLLGNIAIRVGKPLTWDETTGKFDDDGANRQLSRKYRDGWA